MKKGQVNYNNMYKSSFREEEPKTLGEIKEELVESAPEEELAVDEPVEEVKEEVVEEVNEEPEVVEEKKEEVKVEEKKESGKIGKVACRNLLNVRVAPNSTPLQTLSNGTEVTIEEEKDDWYKISKPVVGYVKKEFIKLV